MNNRAWILGTILLTAVILGGGWFVGIAPVLSQASIADDERRDVEAQNAIHEVTLAALKERFKDLDALKSEVESRRASLPSDADLADFIGELNTLQLAHGVAMTDLSVSDGLPFLPAEPEEAEEEEPEQGADADKGPVLDAEAASSVAPASDIEVEGAALVTDSNFVAIPVALTASGEYANVMDFIAGLQSGSRLFLVTGLNVTGETGGQAFKADVSGLIYVLLDPTLELPAAAGEPSATSTAAGNG